MNNFKVLKSFIKESTDINYGVVLLGGSIGEKRVNSKRDLKGVKVNPKDKLFDNKEDAKADAKQMNKILSPGEKKYYGLKYVVAEVNQGKYTGK